MDLMEMDVSDRARQDFGSNGKENDSYICGSLTDFNQNIVLGPSSKFANQAAPIFPNEPVRPDASSFLEEKIEIIKVYLEGGAQGQDEELQRVKMLTDEASQIQEVRYCLKTLREQMASRYNNNNKFPSNDIRVSVPVSKSPISSTGVGEPLTETQEQECVRLKEVTQCLYAQLRELEKRHQEEKEALQQENRELQRRLEEQTEHVQQAENKNQRQDQHTEKLQRLLKDVEMENSTLCDKIASSEAELEELRALKDRENDSKCEQLEKELIIQKEKIHHLDDMLKSQQRKVRHMIEQLQNSRTTLEERDRFISDLEEKVAFLEAENREMHDQVDFYLGNQTTRSCQSDKGPQIVYSKPLTPTSPGNKALPFIKVIEIKS
ncbi:tuftelin 1b isoform X2 [Brachyhypopomus gauderio]|uniref:tuftelin 1b isoform X2 n=1 Tax=Brachyhypopomus gauderio TaxID=698409 RepID=UPI0040424E3C